MRFALLAALGALTLASCALGPNVGGPPSEPTAPTEAAPLVAEAKAKLAAEKGVDPGQVILRSVEATTFNDSSLGCPEPGQSYLQVLTPGYIIRLQLGGETYEYRASRSRVVRCDGR
jgi:hypothetical protein